MGPRSRTSGCQIPATAAIRERAVIVVKHAVIGVAAPRPGRREPPPDDF